MNQSDDSNRGSWRRRTPQQSSSPSQAPPQSGQGGHQQRRTDSRDRTVYQAPTGGRSYSNNSNSGGGSWGSGGGGSGGPGGGPGGGMVDDHVSVNGFNSKEVRDYLNSVYSNAHSQAQNPNAEGSSKPQIYKANDKGWTTPNRGSGGNVWGPKQHLMANGQDFLSKLKKGVAVIGTSGNTGGASTPKMDGKGAN